MNMKKKLSIITVSMILFASIFFTGCANTVNWISPMLFFDVESNTTAVWSGEHGFERNDGLQYIGFSGDNAPDITAEALIAGGAIRSTVNIAYDGDDSYYVRITAFVYYFFDHARLTTRMGNNTIDSIIVLWRNPANGHWFNIIRDTIGSHAARGGYPHINSLSHGGAQHVIKLNRETVADFSELELFIVPISRPTRDTAYVYSGYVVNIAIELPDSNNHFHIFETIATSSTRIFVTK